ncbi:MAG: hypothetical protein AMXMBFR57_31200 [Acidimicrobiia bacterium]|jgi:hypothetical protein
MPATRLRSIDALAWLALAILVQTGVDRWQQARQSVCIDFFTLWAVARTAPDLPGPIYERPTQYRMAEASRNHAVRAGSIHEQRAMALSDQIYGDRLDATGSPLAYALVGWASTGNYDRDLLAFTVVSYLSFALAILAFCRVLGYSLAGTALAFTAFGMCFTPLLSDVRVANLNQLQLLGLAGFVWTMHRGASFWAGAILGASIVFKPLTILVLLILVAVRVMDGRGLTRDRLPHGVGAGAAVAIALGALYFGTPFVWVEFAQSLARTLTAGYPLAHGNFAPAAVLSALTGATIPMLAGGLALVGALVVLWRTRGRAVVASPDETFLIVGAGTCLILLSSGLVWVHYYVLLIPLCLYLLAHARDSQPSATVSTTAGASALVLFSPALHNTMSTPLQSAALVNLGTVLLFVVCIVHWARLRRMPVAAPSPSGRRRSHLTRA